MEPRDDNFAEIEMEESQEQHKKRISKLKKGILTTFLILLLVPYVVIVFLVVAQVKANHTIDELNDTIQQMMIQTTFLPTEEIDIEMNPDLNSEEAVEAEAIETDEEAESVRKVLLTFDDGPSENTDRILDILQAYGVKATFFVVGKNGYDAEYQRIVNEGHTLGMHSYSHVYSKIYQDLDSFEEDLTLLQNQLRQVTGITCRYFRFPGGSSNTVSNVEMTDLIQYLTEQGITYIDWNISSEDAAGANTVEEIVSNVLTQIDNSPAETLVVLFHDSSDKDATVEALPVIIESLQKMEDIRIVPMSDGVNPIQHVVLSSISENESVSEDAIP